jgi:site-specific recombinase
MNPEPHAALVKLRKDLGSYLWASVGSAIAVVAVSGMSDLLLALLAVVHIVALVLTVRAVYRAKGAVGQTNRQAAFSAAAFTVALVFLPIIGWLLVESFRRELGRLIKKGDGASRLARPVRVGQPR